MMIYNSLRINLTLKLTKQKKQEKTKIRYPFRLKKKKSHPSAILYFDLINFILLVKNNNK